MDLDHKSRGRWLKTNRTARGLTQEEAAALAGVPLRTYQEYEQGRCAPSAERLVGILTALGVLEGVAA